MLDRLDKLLQGKKTYVIMVVALIIAAVQIYGIQIPEYVWAILAALGLGGVRSAINKVKSPNE